MTASVMIRTCLLTETTETFDIDEHNTYYLLNVWCPVLNISVQFGSQMDACIGQVVPDSII